MDMIARLLQEAVDKYNLWASVKGRDYDYILAHNDLKGIFYNKLISILSDNKSILQQVDVGYLDSRGRWIRNFLFTTDIHCQFVKECYLKKIAFTPFTGTMYGSLKARQYILSMLIEHQDSINYSTKIECSKAIVDDIVEQIKNYKHVK